MPINVRIPTAYKNNVMARTFVKQMASDGFLPVIALEAFVEGGRTYQAYNRGGFDEARERITEEFSGAVFWLGGVTALNAVFERLGQKILKLPKENVDIASDSVRKPLDNFLKDNNGKILEKTMARFKFIKVISSILIANAFIGFCLPKINQAITRSYHKKDNQKQALNTSTPADNSFIARPNIDIFTKDKEDKAKKDISFGLNLLSLANKFENDRNYKLLAVDAGTASGRAYSARNNDERVEILFRDLSSIYFYMFNMANMNAWLNKIEHGATTRLDPVSAEHAAKYMQNYLNVKNPQQSVGFEEFTRDMLGKNEDLPQCLKSKFEGKGIKIIKLSDFIEELNTFVPASELKDKKELAEKMSKLQPQIKGVSVLTELQAKDVLNGGLINNPEFLEEFFRNRFGNKFTEKYKYVAQNDLDSVKKELIDYVNSIIDSAKKTDKGEVTSELLRKLSDKNLKMNALNWGAGFIVSALFLSTIIPKLQYRITKWRTGSNEFPGTKQFREAEK